MRIRATLFLFVLLHPMFCQKYNYYFGNIHAHTGFSDGNKDSVASGISDPAGSYSYAKLSANFDFLGISEHNHYSSKGNPGFRKPLFRQGLDMAEAANNEGQFLAFYGLEYGVSSSYNGHVVIYGFDSLLGWEETVPGVTGSNYEIFNAKTDYQGLFTKVKKVSGAFCYLAHPSFGDFSTNGTWNTALANAPYNPAFDSVIVGMPLRSGLATNGNDDYSHYPKGHYFNYYKKMLYNGYHLGIGYDHDNHYTNFGRGNGGRLVILAPALSRANFFSAMHERRFYGSDDSNAEIVFECNGAVMGSISSGADLPALQVKHADPDGEPADSIKIWKGSKNSGGLWAEIVHIAVGANASVFKDSAVSVDKEYYYFAEIIQADGQWIVTSPVWYTRDLTIGISEFRTRETCMSYDPVNRKAHFAVTGHGFVVRLYDLQGLIAAKATFSENSGILDLGRLAAGMYVAEVISGGSVSTHKLVLN